MSDNEKKDPGTVTHARINEIKRKPDEDIPRKVINQGFLMEYIGSGWANRGLATDEDKEKYPLLKG